MEGVPESSLPLENSLSLEKQIIAPLSSDLPSTSDEYKERLAAVGADETTSSIKLENTSMNVEDGNEKIEGSGEAKDVVLPSTKNGDAEEEDNNNNRNNNSNDDNDNLFGESEKQPSIGKSQKKNKEESLFSSDEEDDTNNDKDAVKSVEDEVEFEEHDDIDFEKDKHSLSGKHSLYQQQQHREYGVEEVIYFNNVPKLPKEAKVLLIRLLLVDSAC